MPASSQYGVLHHFTRKLGEALQRQGFACRLIENERIWTDTLRTIPDLTIGFNGVPQHPSGVLLCDLIDKPHLCCLMDLSYRYFLLLESPYVIFTCNDRFSCELLQLKQQSRRALFLPPGVEFTVFNPQIPKEFEVTLMATFIDFEKRRKVWKEQFAPSLCAVMDQTIETIFAGSDISFIEAFQLTFNEALLRGKLGDNEQFNLYAIWEQLELYIRGRERVELVKALPDVEIHIFDGSVDQMNWEGYLQHKRANLIFHPPVSFEESFEIMKKSKFVLNSSPHLRNGVHERVFNALACGALPIAEANPYMREIFTEEDLIFYRHPELNRIQEKLQIYSDDTKRQAAIESGRKKVLAAHTWDHRAKAIKEFLN